VSHRWLFCGRNIGCRVVVYYAVLVEVVYAYNVCFLQCS
jgi:hypothetical protein